MTRLWLRAAVSTGEQIVFPAFAFLNPSRSFETVLQLPFASITVQRVEGLSRAKRVAAAWLTQWPTQNIISAAYLVTTDCRHCGANNHATERTPTYKRIKHNFFVGTQTGFLQVSN